MELVDKLGIDLKLLLAQIVNFLVLFFLLKWLLYRPILNLLDKRKKMIEKSVEDAKKIEEQVVKLADEKKKVLMKASDEAMAILEKAKKEGEEERKRALEKAKKEISGLADRYRAELAGQKAAILGELKEEIAELIITASSKIMRKEFTKEDQHRLEKTIKEEVKSIQ
ncbi:MAG: F0F1 ATP synthase subunit B [Candidatus Gracilibacteria bacterium]|jgi:F-type H+-transporting ATPase subunit b